MIDLNALLSRSQAFESRILELFVDVASFASEPRVGIAIDIVDVSFEHGRALRQLAFEGLFPSAVCLLRPQVEALTRAAWVYWTASDEDVERLAAPLTLATERAARSLPMFADMVRLLRGAAPDGLVDQLEAFREVSGHALNSFVHSGIHVVSRQVSGYEVALVDQVVRNSNALLTMCGMLLAIMTGDADAVAQVNAMQRQHSDCLPPMKLASIGRSE